MLRPWICACCGRHFDELPLDVQVGTAPAPYEDLPAADRSARARLSEDFCVIRWPEQTDRFVRALIELPVPELGEGFRWGVWVSLSEASFTRAVELFPLPDVPEGEPARFGWLSSRIHGYEPTTLNLKTRVTFNGGGMRPTLLLEPTDHPLAVEQREGITVARVQELVSPILHRAPAE